MLAYIGLCRPHLKYAAAVWNTNLEYITHDIEMVQHNAVRFISKLKGRDSITSALESLNLETLAVRRGKTRRSLLLKLLANDGFNAGYGRSFTALPYSNEADVTKDMDLKSGSNVTGRFIYKVSGDRIVRGGCTNDTTLSECTTTKLGTCV